MLKKEEEFRLFTGDDGIIIVDTTESGEVALNVLADFRKKVSQKPLKAIILTHFHIGKYVEDFLYLYL